METEEMREQLIEWVEQMKHGYRDSDLYLYEEYHPTGMKFRIKFFTEVNEYSIVAIPSSRDGGNSYLGAIVMSRKPRAGEDWSRGGDLADGDFSATTWVEILGDIVGCELVKIHRPISELLKRVEKE